MWTGSLTSLYYGIGLVEKIGDGLWGHGGQTLGFVSDVAAFQEGGVSIVGWASSSSNIMALGAVAVAEALKTSGFSPANIGPNLCHQNFIASWLTSMPRS